VAEAPALVDGPTMLASGGGLKVYLTDKRHYGITLLLATGSPQHIEGLHALANRKGLKLGPEGLLRGRKVLAARSEEDIYAALGLPFIEPELREGRGRSSARSRGSCRPSSPIARCGASCMRIPISLMVWPRLK